MRFSTPQRKSRVYFAWLAGCFSVILGVNLACGLSGQEAVAFPFQSEPEKVILDLIQGATVTPVQIGVAAQTGDEPGIENTATPVRPRVPIWLHPDLPASVKATINLGDIFSLADDPLKASLSIQIGRQRVISNWVYALVAPFPTIPGGVTRQELEQAWQGQLSPTFANKPLLMDDETQRVLSAVLGEPASGAVQVVEAGSMLETAWSQRPAWAIIPFEALEPRWKVLSIDNNSPIHKDYDLSTYPLIVPISLEGDAQTADLAVKLFGPEASNKLLPVANRDPSKLATLVMTGVTALVRSTAYAMETQGINYPATDIGSLLQTADITHISNEIPFAEDCPPPDPLQQGVQFCSDVRYIELLETVGTDIVELSGDHFADWGPEAMLFTLDLYKQHGWQYYGGGENLEDGRKAVTLEYNGNRLAFIGCNGKGGSFATASDTNPGAVPCDYDYVHAEITRLRSEGYLPIATFQHNEYYMYEAQPDQIRDFRGMAEAGAVIVSGSQAHQPQAMEYFGVGTTNADGVPLPQSSFIHYGLGNLFFDQYDVSLACRQMFIDRHVFYNNQYISTELLPFMFVDYARPSPMTDQEKTDLLQSVFSATGW